MSWLKALKGKGKASHTTYAPPPGPPTELAAPPEWQPAPEARHTDGLYAEASEDEYESAQRFCAQYPPELPRLLPSHVVERIDTAGCRAWGLEVPHTSRFRGRIHDSGVDDKDKGGGAGVVRVVTEPGCEDVCLLSDLPILAGLYDIHGKLGMYYEVKILRMDGLIAVGTTCRPYPHWRLPGWNRLSAGLHLDDLRKFFEDPDGGRDYTPGLRIAPGDTVGLGYSFALGTVFFTHNGMRLPDAFTGVYLPRTKHDVYAAVGVGGACDLEVNFGGDVYRWKEGNEWAWRVEGHVGTLTGGPSRGDDELPSYDEVRQSRRTR